MLNYARRLSSEFVFVRADFYNIDGHIYLGELFKLKNREQSIYLGTFLDVNKIKNYLFN